MEFELENESDGPGNERRLDFDERCGVDRAMDVEMVQVDLASTVCHAANPVAADVAGETVLMSLERNRFYGLGEIGSQIWKRLQSPVSVKNLVADLSAEYEAAPGSIERDVLELLTQLADEGLIAVSPQASQES